MTRPFLRRSNPVPVFCADDPFWLRLDSDESIFAQLDLFRDGPRLVLRVMAHNPNFSIDYEVTPRDVRGLAQFLLQRLREDSACLSVADNKNRLYPEKEMTDAEKERRKIEYAQASGRDPRTIRDRLEGWRHPRAGAPGGPGSGPHGRDGGARCGVPMPL